jgi:hypothetical protein
MTVVSLETGSEGYIDHIIKIKTGHLYHHHTSLLYKYKSTR